MGKRRADDTEKPAIERCHHVEIPSGGALFALATEPEERSVFPSLAGTPFGHSNVSRRLWTPLLNKAELHHPEIHAMRHTFASLHLQNGASLAWVQKQLGHRSMDITLNVYGHFIPGGQQGEADRLAATIGQAFAGSRQGRARKVA